MLVGSWLETSWDPSSVGDNGTSFGAWQMHIGGELSAQGGTPQQAEDPVWAAQHMLSAYTRGVNRVPASLWSSDPERAAETAAYYAEVPSVDYYSSQGASRVHEAWVKTQAAMGGAPTGSSGSVVPALGIPGTDTILDKLLKLFGVPDIKDLSERAGLILFGGILVFVGLYVATKKSNKVTEVIKDQLPNGQTETVKKETSEPKQSSVPTASPGKPGPIESNLAPEVGEAAEAGAVVAV